MFAFEHEDVIPDILTLGKPLANGLPLSAMVMSEKINAVCKAKGDCFFTTHVNDPLVAAVGRKTLGVMIRDKLHINAAQRGEQLLGVLRRLKGKFRCIGDVRGKGLMAAIEIVGDAASKSRSPELATRIADEMWRQGLWCQLQDKGFFRIGPPLNSTAEQIEEGLDMLERVFVSMGT
jgi:4-aminobutyrate aminotransferase-like enzyme